MDYTMWKTTKTRFSANLIKNGFPGMAEKRRNKYRISRIRHVPEKIIWPVIRAFKKPFYPSLYCWDDIEVALIISTGRTGTKFFAKLFSEIFEGVDARHEPFPDLFDLAVAYIRSNSPPSKILAKFQRSREHICEEVHRKGAKVYIEANNNLAWLAPFARKTFENCKIVHVIRDPREYLRSHYSKLVWSIERDGQMVPFMSEKDGRHRISALDFSDDSYCDLWHKMSRFEKICWYWVKKNRVIRNALAGNEQAITIKYEDIFDRNLGYKGLWQIVDFLNLNAKLLMNMEEVEKNMIRKSNVTKNYLIGKWPDWSPEQREQFVSIVGEDMKLYGYKL
jgi:hypothetical protein